MGKFRKKPVVIEAFKLGVDNMPDWFMDAVTANEVILHGSSSGHNHVSDTNADIHTLEGWHHGNFGDYIIRGVKGEIYPCKPDIFEMTYDAEGTDVPDILVGKWIPVTERLPEICGYPVLMVAVNKYGQKKFVKGFTNYECPVEFCTNEKEYDLCWHCWEVTHWMPMPEPPKGE